MKVPAIDDPIRLGRPFLAVYLVVFGPCAFVLRPLRWGLPWYSELSGLVLPPFLVAIVVYCSALFVLSLRRSLFAQSAGLLEFAAAIIGPATFAFVAWRFSASQNAPAVAAFLASFVAYSGLFFWMRKRMPNKRARAKDPGLSS